MRNTFEIKEKPASAAMGRRLGLVGLLLLTTFTWIGFAGLPPGGSLRDRSGPLRFGWYLRSGQWRADLRTLAAAVAYVVDEDNSAQPKNIAATAQLPEPAKQRHHSALRIRPDDGSVDLQANAVSPRNA